MFIPANHVCVARNPNQLSLSSACLAPLNLGSLNSAHIRGIDVPVEEPSTASTRDSCTAQDSIRRTLHPPGHSSCRWRSRLSSQANVLRLYCFGALAP